MAECSGLISASQLHNIRQVISLTSLCLSFTICEMGIIAYCTRGLYLDWQINEHKPLQTALDTPKVLLIIIIIISFLNIFVRDL